MHALRDEFAFELGDAARHRGGDVGGIAARLLGNGDRDRGRDPLRGAGASRRRTVPGVARGNVGSLAHAGDVGQLQWLATGEADHEPAHVVGVGEEGAGGDRNSRVAADALADLAHDIRRLQRLRQILDGQSVRREFGRVERHRDDAIRRADGVHVARARDALEFGFQRVRDFRQLGGAAPRIVGPDRQAHHRHVVDALGLDQRLAHAEALWQPVLVGEHLVVEAHDCRLALHTDGVFDRQHRHARTADRIDVLDALDLRELLFQRRADQLLDLARRRARIRHEDVRHGHVDLRFFLARRHQHRDQAQQQAHERDQRRDRIGLERGGKASRQAQARQLVSHAWRQRHRVATPVPARPRSDRWRCVRPASVPQAPRHPRQPGGPTAPAAARCDCHRSRTRR